MEHYKPVQPGDLNHYGYLFGGNLLKWVDEIAWISASLDYPCCRFVTIGMDRVEFRRRVTTGTILRFVVEKEREGNTSVTYRVRVYGVRLDTPGRDAVFSTNVTFVCLDENGAKQKLPQTHKEDEHGYLENDCQDEGKP